MAFQVFQNGKLCSSYDLKNSCEKDTFSIKREAEVHAYRLVHPYSYKVCKELAPEIELGKEYNYAMTDEIPIMMKIIEVECNTSNKVDVKHLQPALPAGSRRLVTVRSPSYKTPSTSSGEKLLPLIAINRITPRIVMSKDVEETSPEQKVLIKRVQATLRQQVASTKMWVDQYNKYKDAPSIRNAAHSCGLLFGKHQIAELTIGKDNIEPEVLEAVILYSDLWNTQLM